MNRFDRDVELCRIRGGFCAETQVFLSRFYNSSNCAFLSHNRYSTLSRTCTSVPPVSQFSTLNSLSSRVRFGRHRLSFRFVPCHRPTVGRLRDLISFPRSLSDILVDISRLSFSHGRGEGWDGNIRVFIAIAWLRNRAYVDNALKDCFTSQSHDMLIAVLHKVHRALAKSR